MSTDRRHPSAALAVLDSAQGIYDKAVAINLASLPHGSPEPIAFPPWEQAEPPIVMACIEATIAQTRPVFMLTETLMGDQRDKILGDMAAVLAGKAVGK